MRKLLIVIFVTFTFSVFVSFKPQSVSAQAMPVTQGKIDACLAAGKPAQTCLDEALYYLNVECGMVCRGPSGEGSTGSCSGSVCTITCGNGGSLTFPNDQPQCLSATQVCADICYNGEKTDASFRCSPEYGGSKCCNKPNNPPDTCTDNSATPRRQCQSGSSCVSGWSSYSGGLVCSPGTVCCIENTPTPTRAPTPTATTVPPVVPPTATSVPTTPPGVPTPTATRVPTPTTPGAPTSTPTPTKVLCGGPCTIPSQCTTACPVCGTSGTCEATATGTPTPTPTTPLACGDSCNTRTDCPSNCPCTGPSGAKTCAAPTATPTASPTPTPDPFSPAMCKCDEIDISGIASGRSTTVTAAGKVEGQDTTYAKIASMKFTLGKGTAGSTVPIISSGDIAATVTEETATKVRYKSVWTFTMPTLERGVEHRIWTTIKCIKKLAIMPGVTGSSVVLGESTENISIFQKIFAFFANLGDGEDEKVVTSQEQKVIAQTTEAVSKGKVLGERRDKLQLETFIPGEVTKKACQTIYFKLK